MQMKRRVMVAKPKVSKGRVISKSKVISALKLEADRLKNTFANLRAKGVPQEKINMLIQLKKKANELSMQADSLARKNDPNARVVNAKAAKALEFFYENLLRFTK